MSFLIHQTEHQIQRSLDLHSKADLRAIRLLTAEAVRGKGAPLEEEGSKFNLLHRSLAPTVAPGSLIVPVEFRLWVQGREQKQDAFKLSCVFEAEYRLVDDYSPKKAELAAFCQGNAVMNCWPYIREFVQNTAARMDVPLPSLPFLRLVAGSRAKKPSAKKAKLSKSTPKRLGSLISN